MSVPTFHPNKIVKFATNYDEDGDDLTGWRCYLLWKNDTEQKKLILFSITSNHNHQNRIFVSQFKVSDPRPPCLQSKFYPKSFANTNRLVIIPYETISYLKFCQRCPSFCLSKEDFWGINQLHSNLLKYRIKVRRIELDTKYFS